MEQSRFTGWHALGIFVAGFGIVIAVNLYMAREALATFGGLVVENSYVASQDFNHWLDEAKQSRELGWKANVTVPADRRVTIALGGAPAGAVLTGEAWHPLGTMADVPLTFVAQKDGTFVSKEKLPVGRWALRLKARAGNEVWKSEQEVR